MKSVLILGLFAILCCQTVHVMAAELLDVGHLKGTCGQLTTGFLQTGVYIRELNDGESVDGRSLTSMEEFKCGDETCVRFLPCVNDCYVWETCSIFDLRLTCTSVSAALCFDIDPEFDGNKDDIPDAKQGNYVITQALPRGILTIAANGVSDTDFEFKDIVQKDFPLLGMNKAIYDTNWGGVGFKAKNTPASFQASFFFHPTDMSDCSGNLVAGAVGPDFASVVGPMMADSDSCSFSTTITDNAEDEDFNNNSGVVRSVYYAKSLKL